LYKRFGQTQDRLKALRLRNSTWERTIIPITTGVGCFLIFWIGGVRVLAPALFAPPGQWGLRHLTSEEILVAKDFSPGTVAKFAPDSLTNTFMASLVPGKCLVFRFRALFNGGGGEEESKEGPTDTQGVTGFAANGEPENTGLSDSMDTRDSQDSVLGDARYSQRSNGEEAKFLEGETRPFAHTYSFSCRRGYFPSARYSQHDVR
jgi:hypothetical protein